ncbi:hypothetical protein N7G274_008201 [Stereocaulon virgatum]|uniref:Uncharacterized protein n=1 Tax=Stereocaulon virgatum TaxID=373712 RepID=A0ABR4A452_9LECA
MFTFLLLCLTGCASLAVAASSLLSSLVNSTEQSPPHLLLNTSELGELLVPKSSAISSQIELSHLPIANGSADYLTSVPRAFDCLIRQNRLVSINQKSTYMSVLKAMSALSTKRFVSTYDGGTFLFRDYSDVRILVWSSLIPTAPLQYRHVLYGLYEAIKCISERDSWHDTLITLYWTGPSGAQATVGFINITRWPSPDTGAANTSLVLPAAPQELSTLPQFADQDNTTSPYDESIVADDPPARHQLSIIPVFRGETLTLPEIFVTLMSTIVAIADKPATNRLLPFRCKDTAINAHFEYKPAYPQRMEPPYLTYKYGVKALVLVPKVMFQQNRFQEVGFMVKVDGIDVGGGFLEKDYTTSSSLAEVQTS